MTAADNAYQDLEHGQEPARLGLAAHAEVSAVASALERAGVTVHLFEDESTDRPDSVFPNNWLSTHAGGHVAIFPMFASNRRRERRGDIVDFLKSHYRVQDVIDYSGLEYDDVFLEGTGAMVLDHESRVAYACRSNRADPVALERFCTNFGYEPMAFDAVDEHGTQIYHTNVLMCVGTKFALIGLDRIVSPARQREVAERLTARGRILIELTPVQIRNFAGNAIELEGRDGPVLALSRRAYDSLTAEQVAVLEESCSLLPLDIPTIELAGGSVRCMLVGIHLDPRPVTRPLPVTESLPQMA